MFRGEVRRRGIVDVTYALRPEVVCDPSSVLRVLVGAVAAGAYSLHFLWALSFLPCLDTGLCLDWGRSTGMVVTFT